MSAALPMQDAEGVRLKCEVPVPARQLRPHVLPFPFFPMGSLYLELCLEPSNRCHRRPSIHQHTPRSFRCDVSLGLTPASPGALPGGPMVLSEAMVLHSCPRASSTCSRRGRPTALLGDHRCGDARLLSTQETGRQGLPSCRLRVGAAAAAAAEAKRERQTRTRVTFRKKTIRHSCPRPPCAPADVSGRYPQLSQRWLSLRRPRSKPSPVSLHEPDPPPG